jgi:peptidoglycan/xylan/chitin deacetylase (PgdA/CDA1 family)
MTRILRALRRLSERRPLILLYHRVAELPEDRWQLAVSPAAFERQLRFLRSVFRPVPLSVLVRALEEGAETRGMVAITFDDGYADNLLNAKPLLEKHGVPATVFVSSDAVREEREFWWDDLQRIVAADPAVYDWWWRALRAKSDSQRRETLDLLRAKAGLNTAAARATHRPMTEDEVRQLAGSSLIEIGAHGKSHSPLSELTPSEQIDEAAGSKRELEAIIGREVSLFAFPFGGVADVNTTAIDAVRGAGFRAAFMSVFAAISPRPDLFSLPRCSVAGDASPGFALQLARALATRFDGFAAASAGREAARKR